MNIQTTTLLDLPSLDEMFKNLNYYKEDYEAIQKELEETQTSTDVLEQFLDKTTDPTSFSVYSAYQSDLSNYAENLFQQGLNIENRLKINELVRTFNQKITPILAASQKQQILFGERDKHKGPENIYRTPKDEITIDFLRGNTNYMDEFLNLNQISADAKNAYKSIANADLLEIKESLKYIRSRNQPIFSLDDVLEKSKKSEQVYKKIKDDIFQKYNINSWDEDTKQRVESTIKNEMWYALNSSDQDLNLIPPQWNMNLTQEQKTPQIRNMNVINIYEKEKDLNSEQKKIYDFHQKYLELLPNGNVKQKELIKDSKIQNWLFQTYKCFVNSEGHIVDKNRIPRFENDNMCKRPWIQYQLTPIQQKQLRNKITGNVSVNLTFLEPNPRNSIEWGGPSFFKQYSGNKADYFQFLPSDKNATTIYVDGIEQKIFYKDPTNEDRYIEIPRSIDEQTFIKIFYLYEILTNSVLNDPTMYNVTSTQLVKSIEDLVEPSRNQ